MLKGQEVRRRKLSGLENPVELKTENKMLERDIPVSGLLYE